MSYLILAFVLFIAVKQRDVVGNEESKECPPELGDILPSHLSDKMVPSHYSLVIAADLDNSNFGGQVTIYINFNASNPTDIDSKFDKYIILHVSPELKIVDSNTKVETGTDKKIIVKNQCRNTQNEYWVIELESSLSEGHYIISVEFDGKMGSSFDGDRFEGLFEHRYFDLINKKRTKLAANRFHRNYARMVFPCFDEPRFKSEFDIQIIHQSIYRVVCCMDSSSKRDVIPDWTVTKCHTAGIKTPTWLVGFNINQFTSSSKMKNGITHRVWSKPEFAEARKFALNTFDKALKFYDTYTNMPCRLKEINYVALPEDMFAASGMEQWSLINFQELKLLWSENESTIVNMLEAAKVIAHELSHQWFANKVSIKFWRHEWLNEGFASWMQFKGVDSIESSWMYSGERIYDQLRYAFHADSRLKSEPVVLNISDWSEPETIPEYSILYRKGGSLLFMLEDQIYKKNFKLAIRLYLKKFEDQAVITADLWETFQEIVDSKLSDAEKFNVAEFYKNWVEMPGFPYIEVFRKENHMTLTQHRFLQTPGGCSGDIVWSIPVKFYLNGKKKLILFERNSKTFDGITKDMHLFFNPEHLGFYITKYRDWKQLSTIVGSHYLQPLDYASLMLDIQFLTFTGKVPYTDIIELFGKILNATNDVTTWKLSGNLFSTVEKFMKVTPVSRKKFADFVNFWTGSKYDSEMWKEHKKSVPNIRFAVTIIDIVCHFGLRQCLKDARKRFVEWRDKNIKLPPNIRALVYRYGLKESDEVADFDLIWHKYDEAQDGPLVAARSELETALSFVSKDDLVNRYLDFVLNDLSNPNFYKFMSKIANNADAVNNAWLRFKGDFSNIRNNAGLSDNQLGDLLVIFAKQLTSESHYSEIMSLLDELTATTKNHKGEADKSIKSYKYYINKYQDVFGIPQQ